MSSSTKEPTQRSRDKTRIDESEGGDAFLRDLAVKAQAKRTRCEEEAAAVQQRKQARLDKRAEADAGMLQTRQCVRLSTDRLLCTPSCQCGVTPCPQAKLKLCQTCGDIKSHVCRKGPCVAARQPLLLTYQEQEA